MARRAPTNAPASARVDPEQQHDENADPNGKLRLFRWYLSKSIPSHCLFRTFLHK